MIPMLWGRLSPTFRANLASPTRTNPPPSTQRRPKKKWWGDGGKSHGALLILIEVGFVFAVIGLIMSLVAFNKHTNPKDNSTKIVNMRITGLFFLCFGVLLLVPSGCVFMCRFTGIEGSRKRSQRGAEQQEPRGGNRRARERGGERNRAASEGNADASQTAAREEEERSRDRRRSNAEGRSPRPTLRPLTRSRDRSRAQGQCRNGSAETLDPGHNASRSTSVSPSRSRGRSPPGPPPPADFSFPPPPPSYASAINLSDINETERGSATRASAEATEPRPLRREASGNQPPTYSSVADLNEVTIEVGVPRRDSIVRYQATSDIGQVDSPSAPPPSYEVALSARDERNDGRSDLQIV